MLEKKWVEAEFSLDTVYINNLLDSTFISIQPTQTHNKLQEINGIYENMSTMRKAGVVLNSLKLEDAIVNLYGNTAVVTFISHTYKTEKGKTVEKRMRFYDVWMKRNEQWKALSSQGTVIEELK